MKKILKKIISFFLFKIIKTKPGLKIIDTNELLTFSKNNKNFKLYNEGLKKSKNENTDNFLKQNRYLNVIQTAKHVLSSNEIYDFAECGCWRGHSTYLIAQSIYESKRNINFHIFDSFEGLSDSTEKDKTFDNLDQNQNESIKKQFASSEIFLKKNVLNNFNFCKIYKGWIPSRFDEIKEKKFSFVHIDVDLYEPTLKSLEFFFPRLVSGGIIIFDDYNFHIWDGGKKAWDEFFKDKKYFFFYENPTGGCFIIK